MKLSLNWLKRYIDLDMPVDELSEILTSIGLEVEGVDNFETIKGGLEGILVGHVLEVSKHPNADKLNLTKVDIGGDEAVQIVCGAPNVAADQKVLVATIGATLYPTEGDPFKIKKGKIRGEASHGMICAEDELGLGDDHDGIMVLDPSAKTGSPARDYFEIEDDTVFDIGLTPNRSDATSHIGVAKDLAAYLRINKNWQGNVKMPEMNQFKVDVELDNIQIEVDDPEACPRYSGISFSNLQIGPSPDWMQNLLKAVGVRPISNIVDITNFVLHEYGQPLHAFDSDKIADNKIKVKSLPEGTVFLSLDEQERKLNSEDIMICDGQDNPLCIAGVFGGLNSGVTDETQKVFLESAHFNASSVRKTSTRHLLRTDAAKVFEKGSDPNITVQALKRAAVLLKEYAGAEITSDIVDVISKSIEPKEVFIRYDHVNEAIGTQLDKEEIHNILRAMKMELKPVDENSVIVLVPTNKADVIREVDVIEEVLRIYGFNKVEIPTRLKTTIVHKAFPTRRQLQNRISDYLSARGFNEMMGMSLIESKLYESEEREDLVSINNTSNIHLDIMRPDAIKSGLKSISHNLNHQQTNLKLYEFGRSYTQNGAFVEKSFISIYMTGKRSVESWRTDAKASVDFYDIKKAVMAVLSNAGVRAFGFSDENVPKYMNEGLSVAVNGQNVAELGKLSGTVLNQFGIQQEVFAAIIEFDTLYNLTSQSVLEVSEISKFPSTRRDLAVVIDNGIKFDALEKIARKVDKKLIKEIDLFDVYKNEKQLGKGKKSYALKFLFQDDKKTLKDKEVDKIMKKLIQQYENELNAIVRT
ncbi:MAG: phenylalanine--tRNA ligase subunit beta [Saprospiraceae bacterium]|nr:phenylalanine--tRNA ligase subunit beta [Saprospiraceae bacterium]